MKKQEVLRRLHRLGLKAVKMRTGHYKVYNKNGEWMFDVSGSPSDENWFHGVNRDLRKHGLSLMDYKQKKITVPESEVADTMTTRAEKATKVNYVRGKLHNLMVEKGDELARRALYRNANIRPGSGRIAEFARIAIYEVAPKLSLRAWKNKSSGEQAISHFLRNEKSGLSSWALALVEATIDYIYAGVWVTEIPAGPESEPVVKEEWPKEGVSADEAEAESGIVEREAENAGEYAVAFPLDNPEEKVEIMADVDLSPTHKERYVEALLKMLENGKHSDEVIAMEVLPRLDKLLGVEGK